VILFLAVYPQFVLHRSETAVKASLARAPLVDEVSATGPRGQP
jgi:hypothetical protein